MMFTATRCAFAVWLSAPLIAASLPAQTPVLADSDVVVAGIAASKPRKVVEDVLGSPDSISGTEWFPDLHYPGLTVSFTESGRAACMDFPMSSLATTTIAGLPRRTTTGFGWPLLGRESFRSRSEYSVVATSQPPNKRVKLAAECLGGTIAVVRQHSSVSCLSVGAPGKVGRRSLRASR